MTYFYFEKFQAGGGVHKLYRPVQLNNEKQRINSVQLLRTIRRFPFEKKKYPLTRQEEIEGANKKNKKSQPREQE